MATEETKKAVWQSIIDQAQEKEKRNQRLPNEISVDEFIAMSDVKMTHDQALNYLRKLVHDGKLTKRQAIVNGQRMLLFSPVV